MTGPLTSYCDLDLENGNQRLVHGILLMRPHLSVKSS